MSPPAPLIRPLRNSGIVPSGTSSAHGQDGHHHCLILSSYNLPSRSLELPLASCSCGSVPNHFIGTFSALRPRFLHRCADYSTDTRPFLGFPPARRIFRASRLAIYPSHWFGLGSFLPFFLLPLPLHAELAYTLTLHRLPTTALHL